MSQVIHNLSVREVYDKIAPDFDRTRVRVWGSVKTFMNIIPQNAAVLDLGCGNGKNMLYRNDLRIVGIDISDEQVRICKSKNLTAFQACLTALPFPPISFDYMLCAATYHHLDNDLDRAQALNEMYRCLVPGGKILLIVWAMEQEPTSTFNFTKTDTMVPWTSKHDGHTYLRYYHIYRAGELEAEIRHLCPQLRVLNVSWELGNWYAIIEK